MTILAQNSAVEQALSQVGLKPTALERGQMDTVGFASTGKQMDSVLAQVRQLSAPRNAEIDSLYGWDGSTALIAAISPHDDYYYAGRLYNLIYPRIKAKRVVIFGVFHKAKLFDFQDKLVFDSYQTWHGVYGPVKVSPLREEITKALPAQDYIVNNDMQMSEHSVEAMVPFLQAYNPEIEIVSILVPYMNWDTISRLSNDLTDALYDICRKNNWVLGKDIAFVFSADAVHYGDSGWGTTFYAPYGSNLKAYSFMVECENEMVQMLLTDEMSPVKTKNFLDSCVNSLDVRKYHRTWCGRFSIPMGLATVNNLLNKLENRNLTGYFLDYGTSVSEASLDTSVLGGMGATAENNFHHWVGYAAVGYK
jgi:MEMO1 family protein